jgi:hypothetical protein
MNQEQFQQTLREFIRREPFRPFVVELVNGDPIIVVEPTVAFGSRKAGYLSRIWISWSSPAIRFATSAW